MSFNFSCSMHLLYMQTCYRILILLRPAISLSRVVGGLKNRFCCDFLSGERNPTISRFSRMIWRFSSGIVTTRHSLDKMVASHFPSNISAPGDAIKRGFAQILACVRLPLRCLFLCNLAHCDLVVTTPVVNEG